MSAAERDSRSKISYICGLVAIGVVLTLAFAVTGDWWIALLGLVGVACGVIGIRQEVVKLRKLRGPGAS
jgi:1,4-dihydroxy-2-naphthoate octaprenyltransferase